MSHTIPLGITRCYLLVGQEGGAVLVDAGMPGKSGGVEAALARHGVDPEDLGLVLLTHSHWDHYGSASAIRALTGAEVAVHESEASRVEGGTKVMPPGITTWGRIFGVVVGGMMRVIKLPPCTVDVAVGDDGLDLSPYGIDGRAIHTPGHSPGSLTVITDDGDAYVGDSAVNGIPLSRGPSLPIFGEQPERLRESWRRILDAGAQRIHPAHGKPFPAGVMRARLGL